ncbi:ATP-dependent DNA helicase SRS2-like protein [Dissostichus eleginoides]|uniref:ATP-dependent DNA helicase SRS2-like protein n=1 Tax=Dissostichus eleginoides TaxID=100907 RepID=A0AAD9C0C4_DISEL|nr:ATP-dependent DNA helicase SRS2-like protein [Dissostichus eleginoides]
MRAGLGQRAECLSQPCMHGPPAVQSLLPGPPILLMTPPPPPRIRLPAEGLVQGDELGPGQDVGPVSETGHVPLRRDEETLR